MPSLIQQQLQIRLLQRLLYENQPLKECAQALQNVLRADPQIRSAWFFKWKADAKIYSPDGETGGWPPGPGDMVAASDLPLFAEIEMCGRMEINQARQLDCWLSQRIIRAGISHGLLVRIALPLHPPGLLVIELQPNATSGSLNSFLALLDCWLDTQAASRPVAELLSSDPLPVLWVDQQAIPVELNPAASRLLGKTAADNTHPALPVNHLHLVHTSLTQQRVIEGVTSEFAGNTWEWSYLPCPEQQRVLLRGREISKLARQLKEAAQASRLYRLINENTTDLISRHTPEGRFLSASPASWALLGYWPEELCGMRSQDLLHPDDILHLEQEVGNMLAENGYYTMTVRIRHRSGDYLWFEIASRAIRETYTGAVIEIISVSRDITGRVQAEENRRRLAEVVQVNTDLVLFVDPNGLVRWMNPSARQALHVPDELDNLQLAGVIEPATLTKLVQQGWQTADRDGVWSCETRLQPCSEAASFPVSLVLLAHKTAGSESYYSLVARDMTERELREAQQRKHQEELAHTARLITLGELTSGIAHEMNQPLAAVTNYASASLRYLHSAGISSPPLERVAQGLERITEHANHAAEVIKRLRNFLRKEPRRTEALQVDQVLQDAIQLCAWEAVNARVTIEQNLAPGLPPVYADRVLLEQVLLNILRNAIQANSEQQANGNQPSVILVVTGLHEDQVFIKVHDQGRGVAPEQACQLFTPFYTSKADGLGLGLPMSRSFIEGFGGSLSAEDGILGGLCLSCYLPARKSGSERISMETRQNQ